MEGIKVTWIHPQCAKHILKCVKHEPFKGLGVCAPRESLKMHALKLNLAFKTQNCYAKSKLWEVCCQ